MLYYSEEKKNNLFPKFTSSGPENTVDLTKGTSCALQSTNHSEISANVNQNIECLNEDDSFSIESTIETVDNQVTMLNKPSTSKITNTSAISQKVKISLPASKDHSNRSIPSISVPSISDTSIVTVKSSN